MGGRTPAKRARAKETGVPQPKKPADENQPYVPASKVVPELTVKVFVVGIILAWIMSSANAYLGMFAALTVSAAVPASVISMAVFRFFRRRNILENNLVQTTASAGESVTAGIIFSLPALLFVGYWKNIGILETILIAALGGSLGVLFTIPLRRAFIVDAKLQYPEGVATVEVLKSGETGGTGVGYIFVAGLLGAFYKFLGAGMNLWSETAQWAKRVGHSGVYLAGTMSPALVGVGFIIGLPIAILIFLGGVIGYAVAVPTWLAVHPWPRYCMGPFDNVFGCPTTTLRGVQMDALTAFGAVRNIYVRYIGVGGMAAGGVYTLFKLRHALVRGVKSGLDAYRAIRESGSDTRLRTERDMNMRTVLIAIFLFSIPLAVLFTYFVTDRFHDMSRAWIGPLLGIVMLAVGFLFSAVAGYMAGVVGSSNNPISGTGIGAILFTALLLVALGVPGTVGPAAAILIGGTIMAAAAIAGDNMQDLKAGFLLGGTPRNLQIMQMVGTIAAAFSLPFVLLLLHKAYVIGSNKLPAPQANLMYAISSGIFGGSLPWDAFWIGVGIAVLIIAFDKFLEIRKSSFRMPVLAVAIGIYLPFELATPIFLGGLVWWIGRRRHARQVEDARPGASLEEIGQAVERRTNRGVLFASGLIAGESLMGILIAALIVAGQGTSPTAFFGAPAWYWEGLVVFLYVVATLGYSMVRGRPEARSEA